jgi:DNA-binding transcriptional ArsR family regulator
VTSPAYLAIQAARVERLVGFQRDLVAGGVVDAPALETGSLLALTRAADRLLAEYMLRTCERLIDLADGPIDAFFLLGLAAQNAAGFSPALAAPMGGDLASAAQPCSVGALAARLAMPQSTVRRRLTALAERGLAEHGMRGWIVSTPPDLQVLAAQLAAESFKNLRRLVHRLDELVRR